jgi:hypothetical protein
VATILEMRSFSKRNRGQVSSKNEPNSSALGWIGRNHFLPIDMPKRVSGCSRPGTSLRRSIIAGARLLPVIAIVYGLYLTASGKKSAVANPKQDEQLQTQATPLPARPAPPAKPSPIIPADTARVERAIVPKQTPGAVPPSRASSTPGYSPVRYEAMRKKVFGGCTGQLELTASGLHFRCPNQADLILPIAAIAKAHKDGIVLKSGEKYHFAIANQTRGQVEAIFILWLNRVQQPSRVSSF